VADKPVAAVIYTHTHIDHYGGVKGVVDPADVKSGKVPIIAPGTIASFDKFAIGENVVAGNAMTRRAMYAFGNLLDLDPRQMITCGIAIGGGGAGLTTSYISPTDPITETGQTRRIAGLTFEFLYAPDTEAPEEMHIWIPELGALTCAENANHSLHNIQTLRGARTRDARNFARYLDETLQRWGDRAQVHFGPHTWPVWGNSEVVEFLESQRDTYKYIHDQALRLANHGYTPLEAAEVIELPETLGPQVVQPRLPRHAAPRRPRRVHQGTGHVGRQPGIAAPAHPGRIGAPLRRPHRPRQTDRRGPARVRRRRLPVGRRNPAETRLRPAGQPRRQ
jgi:alkyl sulfatase BDS1-like metallo-beta-lactamase superfamily hydrolase